MAFPALPNSHVTQADELRFLFQEHLVEDRLCEGVQVGELLAALGADLVGSIQNLRDTSLFMNRRKKNRKRQKYFAGNERLRAVLPRSFAL